MGRVFGLDLDDRTIITSIVKKLRREKKLLCSDDQFFTPIYIMDICKALIKLISDGCEGVFHIISLNSISRYKIAKSIEKYFNLKKVKIAPCKINSLGLLERRPLLTDLDDSKFNNLFRTEHFDIDYYLKIIDKKS